jgi:hypothetical protein
MKKLFISGHRGMVGVTHLLTLGHKSIKSLHENDH